MAWVRNKQYLVEVLAPHGSSLGMMIHGVLYGDHAFLDWATRRFVKSQPTQLVMSIPEMAAPAIPGTTQRFVYVLDTSDFPDGTFAILYTDGSGALLPAWPAEFFEVYQGSPDDIIPAGA